MRNQLSRTYLNILKHINLHTANSLYSSIRQKLQVPLYQQLEELQSKKDGPKTPLKKRPNRKEEFNKLDEFDWYYETNSSYIL